MLKTIGFDRHYPRLSDDNKVSFFLHELPRSCFIYPLIELNNSNQIFLLLLCKGLNICVKIFQFHFFFR
jgi:hypothetical protein